MLKGYDAKIKTYSEWDHDDHIVPLAFDSAGAIAPKSAAFINKLYASVDDDDVKREWNSEAERIRLKKFFINSLSMTIAKQRVCDIRALRNAPYALQEQFYVMKRLVFAKINFLSLFLIH